MHLPLRCQLHRLGLISQATKARFGNVHLAQGDKKRCQCEPLLCHCERSEAIPLEIAAHKLLNTVAYFVRITALKTLTRVSNPGQGKPPFRLPSQSKAGVQVR
jgi:hypothetical protein